MLNNQISINNSWITKYDNALPSSWLVCCHLSYGSTSGQGPPTEQVSCLSANALHLPSPVSELANNTVHQLELITTNVNYENYVSKHLCMCVLRGLEEHQHWRLCAPKHKTLKVKKKNYSQLTNWQVTRPANKEKRAVYVNPLTPNDDYSGHNAL